MNNFKQLRIAFSFMVIFSILLGLAYPLLITGIGQSFFPKQADGSLVIKNNKIIGSSLIGQKFTSARYFHGRPSYAGGGYNPMASSGSNLGPTSYKLIHSIEQRANALSKQSHQYNSVPMDLITASGSGLDPDISPQAAYYQVKRIAMSRHLSARAIDNLVTEYTQSPQFGFLSQFRVNVLTLNLALDRLSKNYQNKRVAYS